MSQKDLSLEKPQEDYSKSSDKSKNNSTISTKNSQEQLICKTPQNTPPGTLKGVNNKSEKSAIESKEKDIESFNSTLFLGVLQVLFGLLMVACGVLVVVYKSHLGYIGGGIWGGCFATATGFIGIVATSRECCALKTTAQRVAQTIFLAMSLITLAISQLVLVVAATGLARDFRTDEKDEDKIVEELPENYLQLLCNAGLIISCGLECLCAAICAYKTAKNVCPCFRGVDEPSQDFIPESSKDQFISSWLGKHTPNQPFYVVTAPPSTKSSKMHGAMPVPVFRFPPPMLQPPPQVVGYPLIPAPLGPIPSPIITPDPKEMMVIRHPKKHRHHRSSFHPHKPRQQIPQKPRKISKPEQKQITEEELARTYTGLDRTIAEEFIQISESQNTSLCSSSLCNSACNAGCTNGNECNCVTSSSSSSSRFVSEL